MHTQRVDGSLKVEVLTSRVVSFSFFLFLLCFTINYIIFSYY
jgi:hypothetical protein